MTDGDDAGARWALLALIKRLGETDASELAAARGVSASAIRQQLGALLDAGLVARHDAPTDDSPARPGRPTHRYTLTAKGHELFPQAYDALATDLLGHLADIDASLVDEVFERRRRERVRRATARLAGLPLGEAVVELARVLDEDGYLAEAIPPEAAGEPWRIVEHHCAIFDVAARYGAACTTELAFIQEVLPGADVERVHHVMGGDRVCGYAITPRPAATRRRRSPAA